MFDALLKSKFYSKCKANIKLTKTRIVMIKRKRNAMQKYLRNDIVDLLKNHLDYNAYGRAEGFLVELNLSSCYEIVEQACVCISTRLSPMNKQRECPEDCREAVSTLMFAAARFADLPELRSLRTLFSDRYGNSLEPYVNQELVKRLKSTPPTKDMKLQLLQSIALEQGMEWDSKALEQKLYKPPPPPAQNEDNNNELPERSNPNASRTVDQEVEAKQRNLRGNIAEKRDDEHRRPRGRKVVPDDDKKVPPTNKTPEKIPSEGPKLAANHDLKDLKKYNASSEDRTQFDYSPIPPPPYTKEKISTNEASLKPSPTSNSDNKNTTLSKQTDKPKPVAKSVRRRRSNFSVQKQEVADQKDEEEKLMDKLLMHYSKKPSPEGLVQLEELEQKRKDGVRTRTRSLSSEASTSTAEEEKKMGHARANSFQQEDISGSSDQANPKPLDYDDFIARLASIRGKGKE